MQSITLVLHLLLLLIPSVIHAQSCSTTTRQSCSTKLARVPNWWPVPTITQTTTPRVLTITSTPIILATTTVAGVPLTATVSSTVVVTSTVTASTATDTLYLTSTTFSTTAATTTSTTTGVITSTSISVFTSWQTSIIPAPTNFINVNSSSGDSNYAGTKRAIERRRNLSARFETEKRTNLASILNMLLNAKSSGNTKWLTAQKRFSIADFNNPIAVTCTVTVQKICNNAQPSTSTITSTAAGTTTTTTLQSTITATSTQVPPAITVTVYSTTVTSTVTQLTTVVTGATSTYTATSTQTATSTTSIYNACATPNLLGPKLANGNIIDNTYFSDSAAVVVASQKTSAYDCCAACQSSSYCQFYQYSTTTGTCHVTGQDANWCPNNQQDAGWPAYFSWDDSTKASDSIVVGNGGCGYMMDLGQTST